MHIEPTAAAPRKRRRGGRQQKDFEERRRAAIAHERARALAYKLAVQNGIEIPPPSPIEPTAEPESPRPVKVKPRYFTNCAYPPCPDVVGTTSARPGLVFCANHRNPRAREEYEREVDVIKRYTATPGAPRDRHRRGSKHRVEPDLDLD